MPVLKKCEVVSYCSSDAEVDLVLIQTFLPFTEHGQVLMLGELVFHQEGLCQNKVNSSIPYTYEHT